MYIFYSMHNYLNISLLIILKIGIVLAGHYYVTLTSNSPVILGEPINFVAKLYPSLLEGIFEYKWRDNSVQWRAANHKSELLVDTWNVTLPANAYLPLDLYVVQVTVHRYLSAFHFPIAWQRITFQLIKVELKGNTTKVLVRENI